MDILLHNAGQREVFAVTIGLRGYQRTPGRSKWSVV
jgi:hypothetical protein